MYSFKKDFINYILVIKLAPSIQIQLRNWEVSKVNSKKFQGISWQSWCWKLGLCVLVPSWILETEFLGKIEKNSLIVLLGKVGTQGTPAFKNCVSHPGRIWRGVSWQWFKDFPDGSEGKVSVCNARSEERRVGKEFRSRWSPYH